MRLAMPGPWKHPTTSTYYLRQRVPADLTKSARGKLVAVPIGGTPKTVKVGDGVKVSLMTKDPATAKQRYRDADAVLQRHWEAMRSGPVSLSQKDIQAVAGLAYRAFIDTFDDNPGSPEFWKNILARNAEAIGGGGTLRIGTREELQAHTKDKRFGGIVDGILRARALNIDEASRKRLIAATIDALNKAAITNLKKAEGDYSPDPHSESFPTWQEQNAKGPSVTVSSLFELWKKEHAQGSGAKSTVRRWKPVVDSLIKHLGHDDATRVKLKDALEWKDNHVGCSLVFC